MYYRSVLQHIPQGFREGIHGNGIVHHQGVGNVKFLHDVVKAAVEIPHIHNNHGVEIVCHEGGVAVAEGLLEHNQVSAGLVVGGDDAQGVVAADKAAGIVVGVGVEHQSLIAVNTDGHGVFAVGHMVDGIVGIGKQAVFLIGAEIVHAADIVTLDHGFIGA